MFEKLYKESTIITGVDAGNTSMKISYLNEEGNVDDLAISTIVAPAPMQTVELISHKSTDVAAEKILHVKLITNTLDGSEKEQAWYVGEYAKGKDGARQPELTENGESKEKFSDDTKAVFVVPMLTGLALAALKTGKKEKVVVPLSTGLPIETFKLRQSKLIELFYGTHEIKFLDGPYNGQVIKVEIKEGEMQVEAVTSSLAIEFDIEKGQLVDTEIGKKIGTNYALGDLGAGTTDFAVFNENGIDKTKSHNNMIGTNKYIDDIIKEVAALELFKPVREVKGEHALPYSSREQFVDRVLKPQIDKMLKDDDYKAEYKVSWGFVKSVDVTAIVNKHLTLYATIQKQSLLSTYADIEVDHFLLVGGGVLFGYKHGIETLTEAPYNMNIPKLKESQFFTSRGFLIANYLKQVGKLESVNA